MAVSQWWMVLLAYSRLARRELVCCIHGGMQVVRLVERDMGRIARRRVRRDESGASAVEFALVLIPLLWLVFGLVQYGWYFYAMQSGSSAVGDAARRIAVGNCTTTAQVQTVIFNHLGAATTASNSSGITTTITYKKADGSGTVAAPGEIGGAVTVTATFPTLNMHFPLIPVPGDGSVTRTNVTRIEDLDSSQGTCS
jgi:Flp pilus assembly protein TadG